MRILSVWLRVWRGGITSALVAGLAACATELPSERLPFRAVDPGVAVEEAEKAFLEGRFEAAHRQFTEALTVDPEHETALIGLGETYLSVGDWDKARKTFAKVADGSNVAVARQGQGIAALHTGHNEDAVALLQEAIGRNPDLWRAHNALGLYFEMEGDRDSARRHFEKALELNPRSAVVHNNMGYSLLSQKSYDEAVVYFEKALAFDSSMRVASNNLRFARAWQGKYAQAIAGAAPSELREVLNDVGYIAMVRKDYDVAEAYFVRAMEVSPSYFKPAARNLAWVRALKENQGTGS